MNNILIVGDDGKLSRRLLPAQSLNTRSLVTSWRDFATVLPSQPVDIVVLNLEDSGAPSLSAAVRLSEKQPSLAWVYVMNITGRSLPARTLTALSGPGVTWVSSQATDDELRIRLLSLLSTRKRSKTPGTKQMAQTALKPQGATLTSDLHNLKSGRLDAVRTAQWFGISVKSIAHLLERPYPTVHKTPDAIALQSKLRVFLRIASGLMQLAGSHNAVKVWLNTPNADLENEMTPLSVIEAGQQNAIAELLEDALAGQPG